MPTTDMNPEHPLFRELRNGLLWHRTSPAEYRQILADGAIKPNDGRVNRWGGAYACQELGGISLFDFTTQSEVAVLGQAHKWRQFLGNAHPVTIMLGLERKRLPGRLVTDPEIKIGTTGNFFPVVEVCHCGQIPVSAIVSFLLVCPVDCTKFEKHETLAESTLVRVESEYSAAEEAEKSKQPTLDERLQELYDRVNGHE